ncbi:hypothetical protein RclHR1_03360001 [Rhizophagus clarus]|uniref:G-protein coupled receptors family 2 profile 2 domain-containing protein n=1 Tax=Rhizophagus clarus TaxID=94130 RepID=A0A2Z6RL54_9GLOM|nr:hypothetical protein RclHR1_03360001 [Rhizophagus clarus]
MPEYSPLVILYICIHLISLLLLSFLVFLIVKTGSYITKWTLFQLCLCLFVLGLSSLLTIIIYGNSLGDKALNIPLLCIVQNKIIVLIYCPLKLFPGALCVYLWFAVARSNYTIEQTWFWYISGAIWVTTICVNIVGLRENSKEKDWGVIPGEFFCKSTPSKTVWLFYLIPTTVYAVTSLAITAHSSYFLWGRWRNFNQKQNRRTAIDLGYAVRLAVLSGFYSIILLASLIPSIAEKFGNEIDDGDDPTTAFLDFAPAFFGTLLFLIFGTTKSAAIFLPCCYYIPPSDRRRQRSMISQQYSNVENLSARSTVNEPIELDIMIKQDNSGSESIFESNFATVSTRNTIIPDDDRQITP